MRRDLANAQFDHAQFRTKALGSHTLRETGKDADLLHYLLFAYERPASWHAVEVPLFNKVKDRLPHRCKTDAEARRILALSQELLTRMQFPAFQTAEQIIPHLMMEGNWRVPMYWHSLAQSTCTSVRGVQICIHRKLFLSDR